MKKIAIFTRFNICNQGSILQTYATQKIFKELGYDSIVVNYVNKKEKFPRIINETLNTNVNWNNSYIKKQIYRVIKFLSLGLSFIKFKKYRSKYIVLSEEVNTVADLEKIDFSNYLLCSGSDQLWGPIINGTLDPVYYLSFSKRPKFAFSASVGRKVELSNEYIGYLKDFKFITVREEKTKDYLLSQGINNCYDVLDPTLLLDVSNWEEMIKIKKIKKEYILFYTLHKNDEFEKMVKKLSQDLNLNIIRITNCLEDCFLFGKTKLNIDLKQFLSFIKNAKYVITDSFHCTVFSIVFKKKFIVFSPGKTSIRIENILSKLNILNRMISDVKDIKFVLNDIDFEVVHERLNVIRKENIELLKCKMEELYEDSM